MKRHRSTGTGSGEGRLHKFVMDYLLPVTKQSARNHSAQRPGPRGLDRSTRNGSDGREGEGFSAEKLDHYQ